MQRKGALYTILFAGIVCVVCSVLVSTAAVALKPYQETNQVLDRRRNVIEAAGLRLEGERLTRERVQSIFDTRIRPEVIDLETGQVTDVDPETFDPRKAMADPATSRPAPANPAQVQRLPKYRLVYKVLDESGRVSMVVLPIEGKGLWSTLYGFVALDADGTTVRGLTYYQHGETPGLGGEVDNPMWKALWPGRKVYDEQGQVALEVIKGSAGAPDEDPHRVDGISGSTITSRGVTHMIHFWLGENGYQKYLQNIREQRSS
jgi:Na+-transporting NADH:ubiquinone oxidoreductase subunit C